MCRSYFLLALASAVLLFGCSAPRPAVERDLPEGFPHHTARQIHFQLRAAGDTLSAFTARASLVIRAPENSGSFSAEMHDRRNDSLYVAISPGLGIEAARALVTPDSFYFYHRIKNQLVYGPVSQAGEFLPEPFSTDDIFSNLLGLLEPPEDIEWVVESDESYYYLRDPARRTLYIVDPALWRVVRYEQRDGSGQPVDVRVFSEFDEFDGIVLPRRVEFERPQEKQRASIYYRSLSLNPDDLEFALDVRDSAERIPLGD